MIPSWMTSKSIHKSSHSWIATPGGPDNRRPGRVSGSDDERQHTKPQHSGAVVLSFDVEEHHRIEAAAKLDCPAELRAIYANRMEATTEAILERLSAADVKATFFIVGEIARSHPGLIRRIAADGHEIGSHSWDHRRVHRFTPASFWDDLRRSVSVLEDVSGTAVAGYRAPTFSVMRSTAWAVDVLAAAGLRYDSSIFPVRHDRYGVPDAPRVPFLATGQQASILEIPPATWRVLGQNLPVAGGGYFRLFPTQFLHAGVAQLRKVESGIGMLYFHPWEFDPDQPRLPLSRLSRWRTYVGIRHSLGRLEQLIRQYQRCLCRAIDLVPHLESLAKSGRLHQFPLAGDPLSCYGPTLNRQRAA